MTARKLLQQTELTARFTPGEYAIYMEALDEVATASVEDGHIRGPHLLDMLISHKNCPMHRPGNRAGDWCKKPSMRILGW